MRGAAKISLFVSSLAKQEISGFTVFMPIQFAHVPSPHPSLSRYFDFFFSAAFAKTGEQKNKKQQNQTMKPFVILLFYPEQIATDFKLSPINGRFKETQAN